MRLFILVDLPVSVEGAGVGELLAAHLALYHGLAIGTDDRLAIFWKNKG